MPGKGELVLTGQLGDVMKESAQAGISYIRSVADEYGIARNFSRNMTFMYISPEGAVPKDGPSAGITMGYGDACPRSFRKSPGGYRHDGARSLSVAVCFPSEA